MDYKKHLFSNGLQLILAPMKGMKTATVLVTVGAGSRFEEKEINGISHFLEHMAFKGTNKRPTALSISSVIDGVGGEFNAFTSKDHTGYYIKASVDHLPLLVDVLSDMLLHSKFDEKEIEKERNVIIEEINMYEDMPIRKISDVYENLLYGDTPLGRDISGRKEVIKKVKRADFLQYVNKFYRPSNTVISIAGGIEKKIKDSEKLIKQYLGFWKDGSVPAPEKINDSQDESKVLLKYKDTNQAHLCLGVRAYHLTHPSRYKLGVLTAILGGGMSSRLFIEVREKRSLAYYVRSSNEMYTDVGSFATQAGVDVGRISEAVKVMLSEFAKMREKKIDQKELTKAKEYLKGRVALSLEDSRNVASLFASSLLLEDRIRTYHTIISAINSVTAEDVQEVACDIFRQNSLNLAIIGPYKDAERFKKLLRL